MNMADHPEIDWCKRCGRAHFINETCDDGGSFGGNRSLRDEIPVYKPPRVSIAGQHLPSNSGNRKKIPIATGVLAYFPKALAAIAELSYLGNEKHNPGEPLHWSRGKSNDHPDCLARHFMERGTMDAGWAPHKVLHSTEVAWRALAILEIELEEAAKGLG
jgi:hypothetical protein